MPKFYLSLSDGVHGWGSIIYISCKMEIEPMHLIVEVAVSRQPFMHFYLIFIICDSCIYALHVIRYFKFYAILFMFMHYNLICITIYYQ